MKEKLPNATASLVLGIFSIITCWCYGLPGIITGVIGLVLGNRAIKVHNEDPDLYEGVGNASAGKITSIIGLVLTVFFTVYIIWMFTKLGLTMEDLQNEELLQEKLSELQNG